MESKLVKPLKLSFAKGKEYQSSKNVIDDTDEVRSQDAFLERRSVDREPIDTKRKREDIKSTPRNDDFLPDFGCNKDIAEVETKKIKSENDRTNVHKDSEKNYFSGRAVRSSSKRSSFEIKLSSREKGRNPRLNILSSSNSSRSKSKEKASFALTMNPISTTNFKYAIGNLPIKVSRDDDMLFSFRNQVTTNRSIKESEAAQLPESINSKHGEITYLLTSLEDIVGQFVQNFKMCALEFTDDELELLESDDGDSSELNLKDNSSVDDAKLEDETNSLEFLMDTKDHCNEIDDQFDDYMDEEQFNERGKDEDKLNISDSISKAKSIEPKKSSGAHKNHEASLNFTTIDPLKISKSSTTPKSRGKKIKPQISILKSAKSTRATIHSSKKSSKSKNQQHISKTADRKIRKMLNTDGSKTDDRRRVGRISKKSMDRVCSNPNDKNGGKFLITSPNNSNSGRGVIKFFPLKKSVSRNAKNKDKFTSVSTNRPYVKKSNILHNSKDSSGRRVDVSSKSQNNRKGKQSSFYPAPQSLRIKREEEPRLDEQDSMIKNPNLTQLRTHQSRQLIE